MIERHRANDIRATGECNNADSIVRPFFNKFACDFTDCIDTRRFLAADRKILRQHRAGDIQHEHDVDPARLDLGKALAELRTRKRNYEDRERSQ